MSGKGTKGFFRQPDFMLMGYRQESGRCVIVASANLDSAMIEVQADVAEDPFDPLAWVMRVRKPVAVKYVVTASMQRCVFVTGAAYSDALANLLSHWKPEEEQEQEHVLDVNSPQAIEGKGE